jgi:hypothetical protein
MRAFGKTFRELDDAEMADLFSLEREGAIYSDHWIDSLGDFRHVRIALRPSEIKDYVRSMWALELFRRAGSPPLAASVKGIPRDIAKRADEYSITTRDGETLGPPWHCPAAFLGPKLEDAVCFDRSRPVVLEELGREALLTTIKRAMDSLAPAIRRFAHRERGLRPWPIDCEDDVRDLLYAMLRCSIVDLHPEEPVPSRGGTSKVVDLASSTARTFIEIKWIGRAGGWKRTVDEIAIDCQAYGRHPDCDLLVFVVVDAVKDVPDPRLMETQLSGSQTIDGKRIDVLVFVREP